MIKFNYKILQVLLFIFVFIQAVSFITPENMQSILIFDYSIVLSAVFLFTIFKKNTVQPYKFVYLIGLCILAFLLFLFGLSGSIFGFILAASIPFFIFNHITSYKKLNEILFPPFKWGTVGMIFFGTILFINIQGQLTDMTLMTRYFIKASINYVSLMFYGCAMIYFMLYEVKKKSAKVSRFEYILCILILVTSTFYSAAYLTRSTFAASLILIFLFFREKKYIIYCMLALCLIIFRNEVYNYIVDFFGSDSITELAVQDIRVESIEYLVSNALNFNYDFSNTMSHSSLANVFFCLFPLTLFFAFDLLYTTIKLFFIKSIKLMLFYLILFAIGIFICAYQMDFFSVFTLFLCSQLIIFENENGEKKISKQINSL